MSKSHGKHSFKALFNKILSEKNIYLRKKKKTKRKMMSRKNLIKLLTVTSCTLSCTKTTIPT